MIKDNAKEKNIAKRKVHFIGVGGIGMSALCEIAIDKGWEVSGSDKNFSTRLINLKKLGVVVTSNFAEGVDVVYSTAIDQEHAEIKRAKVQKNPLFHRSKYLQVLMESKKGIAVAGTHGKTTTSSLLAWIMHKDENSFAVGGIIHNLSTNGYSGKGEHFVFEADESDGSFLQYTPYGAIITNMEEDHLDYWGTWQSIKKGFQEFSCKITNKENLFWCADDKGLVDLNLRGKSYGFHENADLKIVSYHQKKSFFLMNLSFLGKTYDSVKVSLSGEYNVLNAAAAFGMAISLGVKEEDIRERLSSFSGVKRRREYLGEKDGVSFYDDYAHHPTEIMACLKSFKALSEGKRVIAVFQPHRYSRTKSFYARFLESFQDASVTVITDVYGAGETAIDHVSGEKLAFDIAEKEVGKKIGKELGKEVVYCQKEQLHSFFNNRLQKGDVVITLGAGDITSVSRSYLGV